LNCDTLRLVHPSLLTLHVSMKGAIEKIMGRCMFCVYHRNSYPPTAAGYACSLFNRIDLPGIALMTLLSHDAQISPDKACPGPDRERMNFPCTTAAFTLPQEPVGFVVLCQLAQGLSLLCGFCSPDQGRGRLCLPHLHSGFLQTPLRGDVLAFGAYFC
jgi:hypothetical protein